MGVEGSDSLSGLCSDVGSTGSFLPGGMGYKVGSAEICLLVYLHGKQGRPGTCVLCS